MSDQHQLHIITCIACGRKVLHRYSKKKGRGHICLACLERTHHRRINTEN